MHYRITVFQGHQNDIKSYIMKFLNYESIKTDVGIFTLQHLASPDLDIKDNVPGSVGDI